MGKIGTLGFLGAGRMASAMVRGILARDAVSPSAIMCTSANDGTGEALARETGIRFDDRPVEIARACDVLVLAIKPQQLTDVSVETAAAAQGKLIISILAGTPLPRLAKTFPGARNIVRAMPNTPGQIGAGITAYASMTSLQPDDANVVEEVLGAMGSVLSLPEEHIDAVTALSGSGPAYLFEFVAALREAGCSVGLDEGSADRLARETVLGAARLLVESGEAAELLRDRVTSPGGTTEAALRIFTGRNFRSLVSEAVHAAWKRSRELAN